MATVQLSFFFLLSNRVFSFDCPEKFQRLNFFCIGDEIGRKNWMRHHSGLRWRLLSASRAVSPGGMPISFGYAKSQSFFFFFFEIGRVVFYSHWDIGHLAFCFHIFDLPRWVPLEKDIVWEHYHCCTFARTSFLCLAKRKREQKMFPSCVNTTILCCHCSFSLCRKAR